MTRLPAGCIHTICRALLAGLMFVLCPAGAFSQENASNPLAAVNNTDLRWQYFSDDGSNAHDLFIDGAYMLMPTLKLKYELHYGFTDVTGTNERDFEKIVIKPILFVYQAKVSDVWGMKVAVGLDWINYLGNHAKGIGVDADQLGPFAGLAFANAQTGLAIIPLVQHFTSYNGSVDVNQTAFRIIGLQPFGQGYWAKIDAKFPYDWENDAWPITAEAQLGYNISQGLAIYADGLVGIGKDRPYDIGAGLGIRFKY